MRVVMLLCAVGYSSAYMYHTTTSKATSNQPAANQCHVIGVRNPSHSGLVGTLGTKLGGRKYCSRCGSYGACWRVSITTGAVNFRKVWAFCEEDLSCTSKVVGSSASQFHDDDEFWRKSVVSTQSTNSNTESNDGDIQGHEPWYHPDELVDMVSKHWAISVISGLVILLVTFLICSFCNSRRNRVKHGRRRRTIHTIAGPPLPSFHQRLSSRVSTASSAPLRTQILSPGTIQDLESARHREVVEQASAPSLPTAIAVGRLDTRSSHGHNNAQQGNPTRTTSANGQHRLSIGGQQQQPRMPLVMALVLRNSEHLPESEIPIAESVPIVDAAAVPATAPTRTSRVPSATATPVDGHLPSGSIHVNANSVCI